MKPLPSVETLAHAPVEVRTACCARERLLEISDLEVHYGAKPAIQGVSLTVPRGCITALVGPSGCGKTTFLSSLNRLTDLIPNCQVRGRIMLDGENVLAARTNVIQLRRRVGMIFQKPNPFPLSIRKNLAFPLQQHGVRGKKLIANRVETALADVGLWDEVKDRLNEPASGLSGGQQQRLCLARALALEPEVLLLDEPCSALDPMASGVVEDLIVSLRDRYTVVVVTHNLAQARRIADETALFWAQDGPGRIVEHGRTADVFEHPKSELTKAYIRGVRG